MALKTYSSSSTTESDQLCKLSIFSGLEFGAGGIGRTRQECGYPRILVDHEADTSSPSHQRTARDDGEYTSPPPLLQTEVYVPPETTSHQQKSMLQEVSVNTAHVSHIPYSSPARFSPLAT
ncbi:hypothetical protein RRG08_055662 [Elysia crispata]|uniref:Uncharacterized protein n=1 Tax=Elysia crispata TaxID=231223 RepID=A0AAE0Z826_9GAST|nr:hypothetical protein RRG08_055662 [Elysia crispata]